MVGSFRAAWFMQYYFPATRVLPSMLTDTPPRKNRSGFLESDRMKTLDLPPNGDLQELAKRLECAMQSDLISDVRKACADFLATASEFYGVPKLQGLPLLPDGHSPFPCGTSGNYHPPSSGQVRLLRLRPPQQGSVREHEKRSLRHPRAFWLGGARVRFWRSCRSQ